MGKLGTYKEDEIAVLRAEPPSGSEADPQDEDENEEGENNPETLTDDDIDDIIEQAKENGFDGIDDEGVIDEDEEDLTPEPQSDDDTESEPTDEEETPEEKKKVEGEDEEELPSTASEWVFTTKSGALASVVDLSFGVGLEILE